MVAVLPEGHPLKILNLSFPTCFSSKISQVPRTFKAKQQTRIKKLNEEKKMLTSIYCID
jgi:hypothetical protein